MDVENLEPASVVMVKTGTALAIGLAAHTAYNLHILREPHFDGTPVSERISVLIPARNEEKNIARVIDSVRAQLGLSDYEILILDDDSSDSTAEIVAEICSHDPRVTLIRSEETIPEGWLGKQYACQRLSNAATGSVLVFVDADVELAPTAIAACVQLLRKERLALVAPYPHQEAHGAMERLVQPLVIWSWAATMPVGVAEKSTRPSLSAANGQFLILDAESYREIHGHESVKNVVLEDIALMRNLKSSGFHCVTVNGSHLATCRMYETSQQVIDGYTKSLWSAFGSPVGTIAVNSLLALGFVIPAVAMITSPSKSTRAIGAAGYIAGVTSRTMVSRKFHDRAFPDSLAQPLSISAFIGLNALSWVRHLRGTNSWKGRQL